MAHSDKVKNLPDYFYPDLYDLLLAVKYAAMASISCVLPATVTAVHGGAVDVSVDLMQQGPDGVSFAYPPILGCPLVTVQGNLSAPVAVVMPVAVGDKCLLFVADRCLDNWKLSGAPAPLPNLRMHDISDGFAFVGVNPVAALATFMSAGEGGIASQTAKVAINPVTQKITIANQVAGSLLTIMMTLLTALAASQQTDGSSFNPVTVNAINAAKTQLAALLY
jgi:hypothetical protein